MKPIMHSSQAYLTFVTLHEALNLLIPVQVNRSNSHNNTSGQFLCIFPVEWVVKSCCQFIFLRWIRKQDCYIWNISSTKFSSMKILRRYIQLQYFLTWHICTIALHAISVWYYLVKLKLLVIEQHVLTKYIRDLILERKKLDLREV